MSEAPRFARLMKWMVGPHMASVDGSFYPQRDLNAPITQEPYLERIAPEWLKKQTEESLELLGIMIVGALLSKTCEIIDK